MPVPPFQLRRVQVIVIRGQSLVVKGKARKECLWKLSVVNYHVLETLSTVIFGSK